MSAPDLKPHQVDALRSLARNPLGADIPPAIKSKLRKLGLVGKRVERRGDSRETTSPPTDAGRAYLAEVQS